MRPVATLLACAAGLAANHPPRVDHTEPIRARPIFQIKSGTADGTFVIAGSPGITGQVARTTTFDAVRLDASLMNGTYDDPR